MKQLDQGHTGEEKSRAGGRSQCYHASQGDESAFIFLMTLETETHRKHNDSFVLIQGMVWKNIKTIKSPAPQVIVCQ